MTQERKTELIRQIEEAFADTEYPGDDQIPASLSQADYWTLVENFKGKHWKDVEPEVLVKHVYDLPLFAPEGFRFYLPAYLIAALSGHPDGDFWEFTYYAFVPPESEGSKMEWFLNRVNGFNETQKIVIREFVNLYVATERFDTGSINDRTVKFWANF